MRIIKKVIKVSPYGQSVVCISWYRRRENADLDPHVYTVFFHDKMKANGEKNACHEGQYSVLYGKLLQIAIFITK